MDVSHLLNQTAWVAACTGVNADGEEQYAAAAEVAARVEEGAGNEATGQGTELRTPAKLVTLTRIGPRDRVWLPGLDPDIDAPRMPVAGGSKPAVRLGESAASWYETEV